MQASKGFGWTKRSRCAEAPAELHAQDLRRLPTTAFRGQPGATMRHEDPASAMKGGRPCGERSSEGSLGHVSADSCGTAAHRRGLTTQAGGHNRHR